MDEREFRIDESRGDVFSQIADNLPANPERTVARHELFKLRTALSETELKMAAKALAQLADNPELAEFARLARQTSEFQTGRRG